MKNLQTNKSIPKESMNILLVEDDKEDYLLFKTYASKLHTTCEITWASSYEEGLKYLKKSNYDLCFVDYRLGTKNGIDFIKECRKLGISQGIIMLTGQSESDLGVNAMRAGADDYYNKNGLNAETLDRAIRFTLERRKFHQQERELIIAQAEKELAEEQKKYLSKLLQDLQVSQERLTLAQRAGNIGTFEWYFHEDKMVWTPEFEMLYGFKPGEATERNDFSRHIFSEDLKTMQSNVAGAMKNEIPYNMEFRVVWPDGSLHWLYSKGDVFFDKNGKPQRMVGVNIDISERKKAEDKLAEQAALLQAANDAFLVMDHEDTILFWNNGAERLYGYTEKDALGKKGYELLKTEFPIPLAELHKEVYKQKSWSGELIHTTKDGRKIIVDSRWELLKDGGPSYFLEVNRDITERKALERQKDDFLGIASHELKTPVTSIKAFTQVLAMRFAKLGDIQSATLLQKMDGQINKLTALINDLLDVTKIEGGKLLFNENFFDFDELVDETIEEIQRTTSKHTLVKEGRAGKTIYGDRDRVGQVIINFLTNAIKYSPQSSKIIISVNADKIHVNLSVRDFGVGIPKSEQPHVFERFYRVNAKTHQTVPGIGLGLFISAEIIRRQGGEITVESKEGKGSTFSFRLPIKK